MSYRIPSKPPQVVYLKSPQQKYLDEQERISCKEFQPPEVKQTEGKKNPLTVARAYLGKRLVEKPSGYFLNGVPVNLTQIMRACNQRLVERGEDQVTHSEAWRV